MYMDNLYNVRPFYLSFSLSLSLSLLLFLSVSVSVSLTHSLSLSLYFQAQLKISVHRSIQFILFGGGGENKEMKGDNLI